MLAKLIRFLVRLERAGIPTPGQKALLRVYVNRHNQRY